MPAAGARAFRRLYPTRSNNVKELIDLAVRVIDQDVSLFITGESGSGKDHLASLIHRCSSRSGELIRVDCASIPPDLFESEIFGYEKGAFTDARTRKLGRLDAAQHGTLYFDEISSLALPLQAKLLRVIQEKKFSRLGGHHLLDLDARILSSSTKSADLLVERGELRSDLYYRLNVISLPIPPLRERREDIPLLASAFAGEFATRHQKSIDGFGKGFLEAMDLYGWPGNVRELRNIVERAVLLTEGTVIGPEMLPMDRFLEPPDLVELAKERGWTLADLERAYIEEVLRRTGSNYSLAASILGINRKTLLEKRKRFGLD